MKSYKNWSYVPYRPFFIETGDIYICRVVPTESSITFDWLPLSENEGNEYYVYIRKRNFEQFMLAGTTKGNTYTINKLEDGSEYEFYVACGKKKSRIRLARCGKSFGTIVNYLHPEDECYIFSGKFLCSPTLVRHPEGYLLASMDVWGSDYPNNLTLIYRSDDEGKSWNYVSELFPCLWGKLFIYESDVYMVGASTTYGDLLIGKSSDGGKTFGESVVLMRGSNGKKLEAGIHKNPQPVVEFGGRIWGTLEWGSWGGYFAAMVMSAPVGSNLLDPDSWTFSEPVKYNQEWSGCPKGETVGNIEGCLIDIGGKLYNVMRYEMCRLERNYGLGVSYEVNTEHPENPLVFSKCIEFPGYQGKFEIKYDPKTKKYYSLMTRIWESSAFWKRSLLSLMVSDDCEHWEVMKDVMDMREADPEKIGFQYVDFFTDKDKIFFLCRTAMNNADSYHNSNYIIFDTIQL